MKKKNIQTFFDACLERNRQDLLDRWEYRLNEDPNHVWHKSKKPIFLKCPCGKHESECYSPEHIFNVSVNASKMQPCSKCNSFAQWGINTFGDDFLNSYWDFEKNECDPWIIPYKSFLDGRGCKECAKEKQSVALAIPEDEVVTRIEKVSPLVKMIGGYVDTSSRAKFECKICGNIWYPIVNSVLNGHGCKKCGFNKISEKNRLSNDEFVARLSKINPTIKPLEKYVSGRHSIKMECTSCGKIWSTRPDGLLEGYGCPNCASSKGERAVSTTLDLLGIGYFQEHIFPDCRHKWPLRYDFYIPSINTAIEFQGRQHYEPETSWGGDDGLAERQLRDQIKRDYCADKNICLVEIPYWDIKDVPDIVKNIVMQKEVIPCPIQ